MNFFNLLGGPFSEVISDNADKMQEWVKQIAVFLDELILPITIIVSILGAVWIIWLGVQLAKAEDSGKQKDAKGKLINVVIALVAVIILIWLLTWFAANSAGIFGVQNPLITPTP